MNKYRKYIITTYNKRNERLVIPENASAAVPIYPDGCITGTEYEEDFAFFKTKEDALKKLTKTLEFCRDCLYDDNLYVFQIEEVYSLDKLQ